MSGTGTPDAAEHHLGDRLAALIDGELGHESRERVLAHLATCFSCKSEADAQRRVKSVFADTAPPAPPDGLLARLQGLPAGGGDDRSGALPGADSAAPRKQAGVWQLPYASGDRSAQDKPFGRGSGDAGGTGGFRIHEMERSGSRGRRFAFAAAGAFSLAALAIAGALSTEATGEVTASPAEGGPAAGSARTAAANGFPQEPRPLAGTGPGAVPAAGGTSRSDPSDPSGPQSDGSFDPEPQSGRFSPLLGTTAVLTPPLIRPPVLPAWTPGPTGQPSTTPSVLPSGPAPVTGVSPNPAASVVTPKAPATPGEP